MTDKYILYVDGAITGQHAPTGVGVVVLQNDEIIAQGAFAAGVGTNQTAEILAAVAGLRMIPAGSVAEIRSDSQYVVCTMRDGWRRKANHEYWTLLDEAALAMAEVTWTHVRGHNGDKHNEMADRLAVQAKTLGLEQQLPPKHRPAAPKAPLAAPQQNAPDDDALVAALETIAVRLGTAPKTPALRAALTKAKAAIEAHEQAPALT